MFSFYAAKLAKFQRKRLRRQLTGYCGSQDQCSGNKTVFPVENNNRCHCDKACFKIFSDCCPDYERHCGVQESSVVEHLRKMWKCVEFSWSPTSPCSNEGVTGVWMIYRCSVKWPFDKLRTKCENAPSEFSYPVEDFIPVVGETGETYRNKHCALCNGVNNYTTWNIGIFTFVIPPEEFDIDSSLKFVENNGGMIENVLPRGEHPRRFCLGRNYIANCSSDADPRSIKACVEDPTEVVTSTQNGKYLYFKNFACAACNGYRRVDEWKTGEVCDPKLPEGFSVVFNLDSKKRTTEIVRKYCPLGSVYDTSLKFCREGHIISSKDELNDEFLILLWFSKLRTRDKIEPRSKLENYLKSALSSRFLLLVNQISQMAFHRQSERNNLLVSSFRLTLTPFQTLLMANQNMTSLNVTQENTAFLQLLNFTGNITLDWKNSSFSVVKLISKRLSCYGKKKFKGNEYEINRKNNTFIINRTGEVLSLQDYTVFEENDGNITLCSKLVLSDCNDGAYVPLRQDEYVIFPNLSVYYNETRTIIQFGHYHIHEIINKGRSNSSGLVLSTSVTISVCLPLSNTYNGTVTYFTATPTSDGVRILTLIGFSISISCLALLLITYSLFQELRSVPGLNLMNLSFPTLLSHLIWLIGTSHYAGTKTCEVLAIFEHYFLLVSFVAMSLISFHSCRVFAQPIVGRTVNKSRRGFIKYLVFVWLTPAIFVAICVVLDETDTLLVNYGTRCWLGTKNAKLFLFLLPLAMLLIYNICTFIHTAISLSRHEENRTTLQLKQGKQNLLICVKLATLVGFPWLFMFFLVLFPDVEAFEYLFVIFVCLQGLYIGLAFLFTKKVLKLYKERFNIGPKGHTSSSNTTTLQMK